MLYQIKLGIERSYDMQNKTMTGLDAMTVIKKFEQNDTKKSTIPNGMMTMNKSVKLQPVEKKLVQFEMTKKLQADKGYNDQKDEEDLIRRLY